MDVGSLREVAEGVLCQHDCGYCNKAGDKQLNGRSRSDGLVRKVTVLDFFDAETRGLRPVVRVL